MNKIYFARMGFSFAMVLDAICIMSLVIENLGSNKKGRKISNDLMVGTAVLILLSFISLFGV
jgi:asparagine N-glycosylation enzyme membrane subunit Stt3